MEAAGIDPAEHSPGNGVLRGAAPRRAGSGGQLLQEPTTWKATSTQLEGIQVPKVYAGKVVTDRRKTRADDEPREASQIRRGIGEA
jgi:hypothetical protein